MTSQSVRQTVVFVLISHSYLSPLEHRLGFSKINTTEDFIATIPINGSSLFLLAVRHLYLVKNRIILLTLFFLMFPSDPPENIRKTNKSFQMFSGDQKGTLGKKEFKS